MQRQRLDAQPQSVKRGQDVQGFSGAEGSGEKLPRYRFDLRIQRICYGVPFDERSRKTGPGPLLQLSVHPAPHSSTASASRMFFTGMSWSPGTFSSCLPLLRAGIMHLVKPSRRTSLSR